MTIEEAIARHGHTAKAVRAWCRAHGHRHTPMGAPEEWYGAWRAQPPPSNTGARDE